jgi:hypothetical protein
MGQIKGLDEPNCSTIKEFVQNDENVCLSVPHAFVSQSYVAVSL